MNSQRQPVFRIQKYVLTFSDMCGLLYLDVIDRVNRNFRYPIASCTVYAFLVTKTRIEVSLCERKARRLRLHALVRAADNTSADRYVPVDTLDGLGRMQTHVKRNEIIRMQFHVAHSYSCAATTRVGGGHRSRQHLAYRNRSLLLVTALN